MKHRTTRRLLIGAISFIVPFVLFLVIREKASWHPRVLGQHKVSVSQIVWSPDGKQLVSCNNGANEIPDGTLYLWSVAERTYHVLPGRYNWYWSLQFLADGKITATNEEDFVRIYDAQKPTQQPKTIKVAGTWHVTPDGQTLIGAKQQPSDELTDWIPNTLVLRHIADGKETILKAPDARSTARNKMALSPDGQYFAAFIANAPGHPKPTFWIWNLRAPSKPQVLKVKAETDSRLFFWPDNSSLAAIPESGTSLWVYNLKNGRFKYHRFIEHIALSPTGDMLAYGGSGGIKVLAYPSLKLIRDLPHVSTQSLQQPIAFSPDGSTLAVGETNGIITLWRVR